MRILNSIFIQLAWVWQFRKMPKPDAIIVGTDPQFSQLMLPFLKRIAPNARLLFWSFDLYPEAIQAESENSVVRVLAKMMAKLMPRCYRPVDVMVDIGECMRSLLRKYDHGARELTLVPWALSEPEFGTPVNSDVRARMFGEAVQLGVLYSGTMGKAHDYERFLSLARALRSIAPEIVFAFSARGNRMDEMIECLTPDDSNIRILPFASQAELEDRLNAADIHLLSLRENWTGIVVPSKFFGSLAAGKPVIYSGAPTSCIGQWIRQHNLGLLLGDDELSAMAQQLISYSGNPRQLDDWKKNAFNTYHRKFSKDRVLDGWDSVLQESVTPPQ